MSVKAPEPEKTRRFQKRARSDEEKAKVRERLLDSARVEFAARDVRDVSIRRIADAAGYSQGTLYTYFPSKSALYHCVKEDIFRRVIDEIGVAIAKSGNPRAQLIAAFRIYAQYWHSNADHFRTMFSMDATLEERRLPDGTYFGDSEIAIRAHRVLLDAVTRYLVDQGASCSDRTIAFLTASLLAASHGTIAMPLAMLTMRMPHTLSMHDLIIGNLLDAIDRRIELARTTPSWPIMGRSEFLPG